MTINGPVNIVFDRFQFPSQSAESCSSSDDKLTETSPRIHPLMDSPRAPGIAQLSPRKLHESIAELSDSTELDLGEYILDGELINRYCLDVKNLHRVTFGASVNQGVQCLIENNLELEEIILTDASLNYSELSVLSSLRKLRKIVIEDPTFSDRFLIELAGQLPSIEHLAGLCLSDEGVRALASFGATLTHLENVTIAPDVTPDTISKSLSQLSNLRSLSMYCSFAPEGFGFLGCLAQLKELKIYARGKYSEARLNTDFFVLLGNLSQLEVIHLNGTLGAKSHDFQYLVNLPLRELMLIQSPGLNNEIFSYILKMKPLKRIITNQLSAAAKRELQINLKVEIIDEI